MPVAHPELDEVDQTSDEWRMAYAVWTDWFAERDEARHRRRRLAVERQELAHRQSWWRYLALFATLSATAVVTAIVMFWSLAYVLG